MKNVRTLIRILASERAYVLKKVVPDNTQLGRRVFAHLLFAHSEAIASYLITRVDILNEELDYDGPLEIKDWLAAAREEFTYDNDGFVVERERRSRSLPQLLFALRFGAKFGGKELDPKKSAHWLHVKPAYEIRNRITHPNMPSSQDITDEEMKQLEGMEAWLSECLDEIVPLD